MKKYWILTCIAALSLFAASCNNDDDEEIDYDYLSGTMAFKKNLPYFIEYGYTQTMEVQGVYHPDASTDAYGNRVDTLGYVFQDPFTSVNDTVKYFSDPVGTKVQYEFKVDVDTLGVFNFMAYAYAPDYYSSSCYSTFCVVKPGFGEGYSLRKFDTSGEKEVIGGKEYFVTDIDSVRWMRQNLANESKGTPYYGCTSMTDIFGHFYTWEEAQTACPEGWRLPSSAELDALVSKYGGVGALMGDIYFNSDKSSGKMWTYWPAVGSITDASHLSLMPTGYATRITGGFNFYDVNVRAVLWTSDESDGKGVARYIFEEQDKLYSGTFSKTDFAAPVRCIRTTSSSLTYQTAPLTGSNPILQ